MSLITESVPAQTQGAAVHIDEADGHSSLASVREYGETGQGLHE